MKRPIPLDAPNLEVLKQAIEEYFDHLQDEDTCEDTQNDLDHTIFEAAIEAIYGKNANDFMEQCFEAIERRS